MRYGLIIRHYFLSQMIQTTISWKGFAWLLINVTKLKIVSTLVCGNILPGIFTPKQFLDIFRHLELRGWSWGLDAPKSIIIVLNDRVAILSCILNVVFESHELSLVLPVPILSKLPYCFVIVQLVLVFFILVLRMQVFHYLGPSLSHSVSEVTIGM